MSGPKKEHFLNCNLIVINSNKLKNNLVLENEKPIAN